MKLPGPGTLYLGQNSQFRAPVFFGDTVTATVECIAKNDERRWLTFKTTETTRTARLW